MHTRILRHNVYPSSHMNQLQRKFVANHLQLEKTEKEKEEEEEEELEVRYA
jgi:hypothetical protein